MSVMCVVCVVSVVCVVCGCVCWCVHVLVFVGRGRREGRGEVGEGVVVVVGGREERRGEWVGERRGEERASRPGRNWDLNLHSFW